LRKLAHNFTYPDEKIIQYKYLGQRLFLCCIGFAPGGRFSYDDQPWLRQANALCSKGAPLCRSVSYWFHHFFIYGLFAEFFCSVFIILGLFTRLACIPLIIAMSVALFIANQGDFFGAGESAGLFLTCFVALLFTGPGKVSLDRFVAK